MNKYIITEEQFKKSEKWKKFNTFLRRRSSDIKEMIEYNAKQALLPRNSKNSDFDYTLYWTRNLYAFSIDLPHDDEKNKWLYEWLKENMSDYITETLKNLKSVK